jgi:Mor family transcriptional regulator
MIWPPKFAQIVAIIGEEAAWKLINQRGGIRLRVPLRHEQRLIEELIGAEPAMKLCAEYGGDTIEVPRLVERSRELRDAEIAQQARMGSSISQLARRYALTERGVSKILARFRIRNATHQQPELWQ